MLGGVGAKTKIAGIFSSMAAIRIAIAQLRPRKGEYADNVARLGEVIARAATGDSPADLVVATETATSGYFVEGGVRDVAVTAGSLFEDLQAGHRTAKAPAVDVAV